MINLSKKLNCIVLIVIFLITLFSTINISTKAKSITEMNRKDYTVSVDAINSIELIHWIVFAKGTFYVEDSIMKGTAATLVNIRIYLILPIPYFETNVSLNLALNNYVFFIHSPNLLIYTERPNCLPAQETYDIPSIGA